MIKPCKICGSTDFYILKKSRRCKPCSIKRSYEWNLNNPDRVKRNQLKHRESGKQKEKHKIWIENNKEYVREQSRKYRLENLEYYRKYHRISEHEKRAKLKKSGGKLSKDITQKLFKLQQGKCACCGKPLGNDYHLDHIMPLALGGLNIDSNIQLLTSTCNMQKNKKHPIDYMQSKGFLL